MGRTDLSRDDLKANMKEFDHQRNGSIQFLGFLEMMSPRRQRIRDRYLNAWEEVQKRARITSGLEGVSTRYKRYTGGVNVPPIDTYSIRNNSEDHAEINRDINSYINEAKFGIPHRPPSFSMPHPPASPMKTNQSRTPRRTAAAERGFCCYGGGQVSA